MSINNSLSPGVSEMVIAFGVPDGGTVSNAMRNSHVYDGFKDDAMAHEKDAENDDFFARARWAPLPQSFNSG